MEAEHLSVIHINALLTMHRAVRLTETGLSRHLSCDKVLARNVLTTLVNLELARKYGPYEYAITENGVELLVNRGKIYLDTKAKQPKQPKPPKPAKPAKPEKAEPKPDPVIDRIITNMVAAESEELKAAKPPLADFDTLVRQGLTRLNKQMGMQPVTIDRLDLKVETLQSLATMIETVDQQVADVLLSIALDLQRMPK